MDRKIIFKCRVGSHLYGLNTSGSDEDFVSVFLPSKGDVFGLNPVKQIDNSTKVSEKGTRNTKEDVDDKMYSLPEFLKLLLGNNPNIIEMLFVDEKNIIILEPEFKYLMDNYDKIVSQKAYHTFCGYAYTQRKKLIVKKERYGSLVQSVDFMEEYFKERLKSSKETITEEESNILNDKLTYYKSRKQNCNSFHKGMPLKIIYEKLISERDNYGWRVHTDSFEKVGYDCFVEGTQFLTSNGWKVYDEIKEYDFLATENIKTGELEFQQYIDRGEYNIDDYVFDIENKFYNTVTTGNHNMYVSPLHRSVKNNYSYKYNSEEADWKLIPVSEIDAQNKSWYFVKSFPCNKFKDYPITDEYLILMGLYISDGTVLYRNDELKEIRLAKTTKGKIQFFEEVAKIKNFFNIKEYMHNRVPGRVDYTWVLGGEVKNKIVDDCGERKNKHFPDWIHALSSRQSNVLLHSLYCGDGTEYNTSYVYYNTILEVASGVHTIALLAGKFSRLRGPYHAPTEWSNEDSLMYQIYWSKKDAIPTPMKFNHKSIKNKKRILSGGNKRKYKGRVFCFTVPNSTLVTRMNGKSGVAGNCKFGYHLIRILVEGCNLLAKGKLEFPLNGGAKEDIMKIRRCEVDYESLLSWYDYWKELAYSLKEKTGIRSKPDFNFVNDYLIDVMTKHLKGEEWTLNLNR